MPDEPRRPRLIPLPPPGARRDDDGWTTLVQPDSINHIPLADVVDVFATAGIEVRVQIREKK